MQKYVFELTSDDAIVFRNIKLIIDRFVPISSDEVGLDCYSEEDGDPWFLKMDYNDVVTVAS